MTKRSSTIRVLFEILWVGAYALASLYLTLWSFWHLSKYWFPIISDSSELPRYSNQILE
ncbi:hypothetical protein K458DRAFT_412759 [Lentithecium fluviatile CBS 122367]|uniref:Uncharacterized protein n=1 Tax=Lentithecium fluviatile CBS 122367 TaxID=1168545 RepID=A0A6G1JH44_9PLEO|nr:hypothetical protein K458DRAFT_412759 [Lentithecium fluviatile CBS 122367]